MSCGTCGGRGSIPDPELENNTLWCPDCHVTKFTEIEVEARYADYKHGWFDGANRRVLGTQSEPTHLDEYRKGHADGLASFNGAMKARFEALTGKTEYREETEQVWRGCVCEGAGRCLWCRTSELKCERFDALEVEVAELKAKLAGA